jgi:hypothetical protein
MDSEPAGRLDVLRVACPPLSVPVPSTVVLPNRNVTVPVGVPLPDGVTVAVNVTTCPTIDGFKDEASIVVVAVFATTFCVIAGDVLPFELVSPPYSAVTVWRPMPRVERGKVADPFTNDAVPSTVFAPCLKVTVPVALPPYCPVTVATKLTVWPTVEGFGLEFNVVVVPALPTDCDTAEDTLAPTFPFPAYAAVMLWPPADNAVVAKAASPEPFNVADPIVAAPSLNVTMPVGVPEPTDGVTVAVNVTIWPQIEGFSDDPSAVLVAVMNSLGYARLLIAKPTGQPPSEDMVLTTVLVAVSMIERVLEL